MKYCSKLVWTYWVLTTVLLVGMLAGSSEAMLAVIILNIVQVFHFIIREKSIVAFPVQVRITYLGLIFVAQAPHMVWVSWWLLIGTSAMVLFGYCFLARLLSLLPYNKKEPYGIEMIKQTFFSPPKKGNILQGSPVLAE